MQLQKKKKDLKNQTTPNFKKPKYTPENQTWFLKKFLNH